MTTEKTDEPKKEIIKPGPPTIETIRMFGITTSEHIGELAGALAKSQGECLNGSKDKQGYGYKYMTLPNLTEIIRPTLAENGLSVIQAPQLIKGNNASVVVHTRIMHASDQWLQSSLEIPLQVMKQLSPAQMEGVAITYGRRYALQAMFLIAADEDTDGVAS